MSGEVEIRPMIAADVADIAALASHDDSMWTVADYLSLQTLVAIVDGGILAGFVCARTLIADEEHEVLNVLVAKQHRGKGIGFALMSALILANPGTFFLEVREGNVAARQLYLRSGFVDFGIRKGYYRNPEEDAITMRRYFALT